MSLEEDNKQRGYAFFDAMNKGDSAAIVAVYAEDGYVQTMEHTLISGK